jgi:hypothetical protein
VARGFGGFGTAVGRAVWLISLGGVVWGIGNFVWFVYNVRGTEAPYPSIADVGYLGMLPLAAVGLFSLTRVVGVSRAWILRSTAIAIAALMVTGHFTLPQIELLGFSYGKSWLFDPSYTFLPRFISALYVACDVVLITFAAVLALNARKAAGGLFFQPVLAVVGAMIAQYAGDLLFFHRVAYETYYNADISDGLYAVSMVLIAVSAWRFGVALTRMTARVDESAS